MRTDHVAAAGPEPRVGDAMGRVDESRAAEPFIHPDGRCASRQVGPGTRVWGFAQVLAGAIIGRDCNICSGAFIEGGATIGDRVTVKNGVLVFEGVHIGDDVFLGPGAVFTNDLRPRAHIKRPCAALMETHVESGVTLGAGTVVVCGVTIGHDAFSAAGAVITRDVAPHAFVAGNPARQRGWVCRCGERLAPELHCACGRSYQAAGAGLEVVSADKPPGGFASTPQDLYLGSKGRRS